MNESGLIEPHGGFRDMKSCQGAEIIFDATVAFCARFVPLRSRTHDQMVPGGTERETELG